MPVWALCVNPSWLFPKRCPPASLCGHACGPGLLPVGRNQPPGVVSGDLSAFPWEAPPRAGAAGGSARRCRSEAGPHPRPALPAPSFTQGHSFCWRPRPRCQSPQQGRAPGDWLFVPVQPPAGPVPWASSVGLGFPIGTTDNGSVASLALSSPVPRQDIKIEGGWGIRWGEGELPLQGLLLPRIRQPDPEG